MRVDDQGRLVDSWGPAASYGFDGLDTGEDVCSHSPFLEGYLDSPTVLPFVNDSHGHAFDVHVIPAGSGSADAPASGSGTYVLLVDARPELEQRQRAQQTANEVKLLLERERRIIGELVDAKAELTVRRDEAEAENRRRGEYIATMSHEFRTPLMALLAHVDRLGKESLPPIAKDVTASIRRIAQQHVWLVDNLLAGARVEAEGFSIHRQATDLRVLVDDLCVVFAPLAAAAELSFAAYVDDSVPEYLLVDDLHLRQVLVNLLGNAIKFTEDGSVDLSARHDGSMLRLTITDTGPGIAEAEQARLFEAFQRGGESPRRSGAGLGLAITRSLVDAMEGTIELESKLGSGTRITVELDAEAVQTAAGPATADGSSILIGEDDPDVAELMMTRLGEAGYRVRVVGDGLSVVEAATAETPDLIIVDTNMPGIDGPTAARRLREGGCVVPILALSAAGRRQDIEFALASGCTEFLRKPAHPETLKRVVRELILKDVRRDATARH